MARESDPGAEGTGQSEDLYDIATWEPRSRVDRVAVTLSRALRAHIERFLVVLAVVLLFVQFSLGGFVLVREPRLDALTALSVVPAFALAALIWYLDPTEREPLQPLAATFVLGVLFSSFAAFLNTVLLQGFRLLPVVGLVLFFYVVVGPLEETVKWFAVRVAAFPSPSFDTAVDGMVYGAVAGLGFATVENAIYISREFLAGAQPGVQPMAAGQIRAAVDTAAERAFVGPGHVLYSSISGYYLGLAKRNPASYGPLVVKGVLLAALVHATYDTVVTYAHFPASPFVAFLLVYDGVVFAYLYRKLRRYRRAYRGHRA